MDSTTTLAVAGKYLDAVSAKDFATVAGLFAEDIVGHQPGDNRLSGTHRGRAAVNEMLGAMMAISEETLELATTGAPLVNDNMVAVPVQFSAQRDGATLGQDGVDVLRIDVGRIAEVWLFSSDPHAEDTFWGAR